jgi:hypothetical protein
LKSIIQKKILKIRIFCNKGYKQSNSNWQFDKLFEVFLYFPAGTSIQFPPTTLQSIMKRRAKRTLLSYVMKLLIPSPSICMPLSRIPANDRKILTRLYLQIQEKH